MTETNERVTVDFDSQSYYLDGEYWESWDNYGEEMADKINELLNELHEENEQLKQSIDWMGGRLQGLWAHYNANRWSIWSEAVEDIANELGFKIHHVCDIPISDSESKKERVEGVKKITEILQENKELKVTIGEMEDYLARMEEENKELKEQLKDCTKKAKEEIRKKREKNDIRWGKYRKVMYE